jgi:hypothetical protein
MLYLIYLRIFINLLMYLIVFMKCYFILAR